jgi:hypothetical protein
MWEVIIEEYSPFKHKNVVTGYKFESKQNATEFIEDMRRHNPVCGILLDGTHAIDDEDNPSAITRVQYPVYK